MFFNYKSLQLLNLNFILYIVIFFKLGALYELFFRNLYIVVNYKIILYLCKKACLASIF